MGMATKGSQMWLQKAVNEHQGVLDKAIREALGLAATSTIQWMSPRQADGYREYRDEAALKQVEAELGKKPLSQFWPKRGPVWDALAIIDGRYPLFVEAKAHIAEMASPRSQAGDGSLKIIKKSLDAVRAFLGVKNEYDWSGTFYQYANRLAHHHLVNDLNRLKSYLVFLYFLNADDMSGPRTREEWEAAILLMKTVLGLGKKQITNVKDAFLDCRRLKDR